MRSNKAWQKDVTMQEYRKITEYANAKINLFLDVTAVRDDGFHEIVSVMQTVDLCDRIDLLVKPSERDTHIELTCNWDHIPTDSRNLVWRAAERFCSDAGIPLI